MGPARTAHPRAFPPARRRCSRIELLGLAGRSSGAIVAIGAGWVCHSPTWVGLAPSTAPWFRVPASRVALFVVRRVPARVHSSLRIMGGVIEHPFVRRVRKWWQERCCGWSAAARRGGKGLRRRAGQPACRLPLTRPLSSSKSLHAPGSTRFNNRLELSTSSTVSAVMQTSRLPRPWQARVR